MARLAAVAHRHARWRELTAAETGVAVAELQEIAAGRGDLLVEVAGILAGAHEGELDEPKARAAAQPQLLKAAGLTAPVQITQPSGPQPGSLAEAEELASLS